MIEVNGNNFIVASNDALVKAYEAGNTKTGLSPDVEKEIGNKSSAVYIDIAAILQKSNSTDTGEMKTLQAARSTFKNFIAFTDKGNDKTTKGGLELNTVTSNENSLASIAKFLAIAHEEDLRHRKNFDMHPPVAVDSIPGMNEEPEKSDAE